MTTTITNHTTICWACAEALPRGATRCSKCGESQATNPGNDVDGWDGERLSLRLGGHVPSEGCCVGCERPGAGLVKKQVTHTPALLYLTSLPAMLLGPIIYLLVVTARQLKTTIGVRICWRCRARELGLDLLLFVGCVVLFPVLFVPAVKVGEWMGAGAGLKWGASLAICGWIAATIYAKGWLAPRTSAIRSHGMDERAVQLSFRCSQAIRV